MQRGEQARDKGALGTGQKLLVFWNDVVFILVEKLVRLVHNLNEKVYLQLSYLTVIWLFLGHCCWCLASPA